VHHPESSFGGRDAASAASPERIEPASAAGIVGHDGDQAPDGLAEVAD